MRDQEPHSGSGDRRRDQESHRASRRQRRRGQRNRWDQADDADLPQDDVENELGSEEATENSAEPEPSEPVQPTVPFERKPDTRRDFAPRADQEVEVDADANDGEPFSHDRSREQRSRHDRPRHERTERDRTERPDRERHDQPRSETVRSERDRSQNDRPRSERPERERDDRKANERESSERSRRSHEERRSERSESNAKSDRTPRKESAGNSPQPKTASSRAKRDSAFSNERTLRYSRRRLRRREQTIDPIGRFFRRNGTVWRHTVRRSIVAQGVDALAHVFSPQTIATLPDRLGLLSRRIHVKRPERKQIAVGFYRSVTRFRPFDNRMFLAPLGDLLRRTASQPVRVLARWAETSVTSTYAAIAASGAAVWAVLLSPAKLGSTLWRWWNLLLDSADSSYQREVADHDARRRPGEAAYLMSADDNEEPERTNPGAAWTFVAITGVIGVILAFILQFSGGEAKSSTNARLLAAEPVEEELQMPELGEPEEPRWNPPIQPEPLVPAANVLEMPPNTEPVASERPVVKSLDVRWIMQRREHAHEVELPPDEFHVRAGPAPQEDSKVAAPRDDWNRFVSMASHTEAARPVPFADRIHPVDRERIESELAHIPPSADTAAPDDYDDGARGTPPKGDAGVSLEVEKQIPQRASTGEPLSLELVVKNAGTVSLPHVSVEDLIADASQIQDISPMGIVRDGSVRWALGAMKPGDKQVLKVRLNPSAEGSFTSTARVRSFATVSFQTAVSGPKLALEVTSPGKLEVGEACPIKFKITNKGEARATQVVLRESLPAELKHGEGRLLDHEVGALEPGETREAQLTVIALASGEAFHEAKLLVDGKVQDAVETAVAIVDRPVATPTPKLKPRAVAPVEPPKRRAPVERPPERRPVRPPVDLCRPVECSPFTSMNWQFDGR